MEVTQLSEELISVICTVKNGEKTLEDTILSALEQTYENWEFIIVDDGSDDSTTSIIEKYAKIDKRIKPVYTDGIGRGKALNLAIQESKGNYIANIDADDLMHPERLQIQLEKLIENNDAFLICSESIIIYDDQKIKWESQSSEGVQYIKENLLIKNRINHSSVMFNKQQLIEIGCYNSALKSQFDYELWLRALSKNKIMLKLKNKLVAKRIHANQSFENKKRLIYLIRSQFLQIKYAIKIKRYFFIIIMMVPLRIVVGTLPFNIRRKIKDLIKKIFPVLK